MNHRPIRQAFGAVAALTAVVYLALVVLASGCLFMHAVPSGGHEHHTQDSSHSPLCAWSCQALSGGGLVSALPVVTAWSVERTSLSDLPAPSSSVTLDRLRARAPPQPILS